MNGRQYSPQMVPVIDLRAILGDTADGIFGLKDLKGKIIVIDSLLSGKSSGRLL